MGCVVSSDDRRRIIGVSHHHHHHHQHIVSLTSSTYGILTSPRAYSSLQSSPPPPPPPQPPTPEVINSWELMAGLVDPSSSSSPPPNNSEREEEEESSAAAVLYTTSLRGVRATFEACNAVRAALQAHGVAFRERDVSMDRGFLRELLATFPSSSKPPPPPPLVPRLFVRGRHVGGADEVLRLDEEGALAPLLEGLPKARGGGTCCDGCGGMRFLPCFQCSGSRKLVLNLAKPPKEEEDHHHHRRWRGRRSLLVVRCRECN